MLHDYVNTKTTKKLITSRSAAIFVSTKRRCWSTAPWIAFDNILSTTRCHHFLTVSWMVIGVVPFFTSFSVSSSLHPGQMYTVDVVTQSGIRPDEFPSTSHSAGPLQFWTSTFHRIISNMWDSKHIQAFKCDCWHQWFTLIKNMIQNL